MPLLVTNYETVLSARQSTSSKRLDALWGNGGDTYIGYGTSSKDRLFRVVKNTKITVEKDGLDIYADDIYRGSFNSASAFETPVNITLFCSNTNGTYNNFSQIRFYDCKIFKNGTLERDVIPCYRKSDNEIGLYDLVNSEFYTNQGSGNFTKGPDVI